jgi:hypothetical protein
MVILLLAVELLFTSARWGLPWGRR